ncbi:hypothetical protein M2347_000660 [Chryseobacterium sp. H1D6B]|uniref:beta strand repeat-containing protein n=1 Tax=Chryseobacterium sp. H1D6B TaxID=2940588 RepID=UPI0015CC50C5|nr:T9SS type A sorting domain-containing protein [Chryseobacterium sp. H1D6B]MDH6250933.1 hypothetical protein [Chryseobacterium sp. H1D6B]
MKKTLFCLITSIAAMSFHAQVSIVATSGTAAGTYTTLKDAFDAVNSGTHQGSITMSITGNTTETATAALNASGGTASYTSVVIKPAAGVTPTISGNISAAMLIKILGNNVTIDGSNTAGGTTRDLTITNTSVTAPQVIAAASASAAAPVTNLTIKNSNIINGINTSSALVITDGNATAAGGYFNNVTIQNNSIQKAYIGMYLWAAIAAGNGSNTVVKDNVLNTAGANAIRFVGIYLQGVDGGMVNNNTVGNFETASTEIKRAIWFATGTVNSSIVSNTITNIGYSGTGAGGAVGITITSGNTGAVAVANNLVNKNVITNMTSSGTSTAFAGVFLSGVTGGTTISQNNINTIKNTNTGGYGAVGILLSGTATAGATNVVNNFVSDVSGYGYNGGSIADNGYGIAVTSGTLYNLYYNTVNQTVSQTVTTGKPAALNITSGVTAAGAIDLRNNIFVTSQAGTSYAVYSGAANTVFSNINYNDYYSTNGALGYIGSDRTSLAAMQTGFGGNVNSINVLPVFVSNNNLHLVPASNAGLDNKGTPIASVTVDFDNNARSATTPDLGASEFTAVSLGVHDAVKNKISYYPNPVIDYLYINNTNKIKNVEVYNTAGQRIINENVNAEKGVINLTKAPAGVYILKVNSEVDTQSIKVIKK